MRVVLTQPSERAADGRSHIGDVGRRLAGPRGGVAAGDIVLLPELVGGDGEHASYVAEIQALARGLSAWVVGGSHLRLEGGQKTNCGVVADPEGRIIARYGKRNPYGDERAGDVRPGAGPAAFEAAGLRCLAVICADFWHTPVFGAAADLPELILVPALSASQRPEPHMARARWRHATVARAYEFAAFVAVSDWAHPVRYEAGVSSGVAGLAHPNPSRPALLHRSLGRRSVRGFDLDLEALRDLRRDRERRGFDLTSHLRLPPAA
jgi:predicted amidohydrolase